MEEINYHKFLAITNLSAETFKSVTIKKKIQSLASKGYVVTNVKGRGLLAVFECTKSSSLLLKEDLQETLGVSIKHPEVMEKYLELLCGAESEIYLFKSDLEISEILLKFFKLELNTLKMYVCNCRIELTKCGWMKPIDTDKCSSTATKKQYVIKDKITGERRIITPDEYLDNYKYIYFIHLDKFKKDYMEINNVTKIPKEDFRRIACKSRRLMEDAIGGYMYVVYKKEFKIGGFNNLDNS